MSPQTMDLARRFLHFGSLAAVVFCVSAAPARAIVGGTDGGSRSSVMVLSSRGGTCTGIVLALDVILTAAHCLAGAAEHRVHFRGADGAPVLLQPKAKQLHPGFSAGAERTRTRSVDLAVIQLAEALPSSFHPAELSAAHPGKGSSVTVGGYGLGRESDGRSGGTFRSAELDVVEPYGPGRILLWAAPGTGSAGACHGDSGGSMSTGDAVVATITWAKGRDRQSCGSLTQGTLLGPQRGWIDGALSRWGRTAFWR